MMIILKWICILGWATVMGLLMTKSLNQNKDE